MKFANNKKAEMMGLVVKLTAFLAATVVLVAFFGSFFSEVEAMTDQQLCRLSVVAKIAASAGGSAYVGESRVRLECYTQSLSVKEDGIYISGKKRKPKRLGSEDNFVDDDEDYRKIEKVQKAIADQMYFCWDQFLEGKLPPFKKDAWLFPTKEERCVLCATFNFANDWLDGPENASVNIGDFLNTAFYPGQKKHTYARFLGGRFESNMAIDTSKQIWIAFTSTEDYKTFTVEIGGAGLIRKECKRLF